MTITRQQRRHTPAPEASLEQQFNRAHISHRDFEEAEEYLRAYEKIDLPEARRGLLVAGVVAYARPLTNNDTGESSSPCLPTAATRGLDDTEKALFQRILALRHQAIVHSAFGHRATRRVRGMARGFVASSRLFDIHLEITDPQLFLQLTRKLQGYCRTAMFELNRKLQQ